MRRALLLTLLVTACSAPTEPCGPVKQPALYIKQYDARGVLIKADTIFVKLNTCTGEVSAWEEE